MKAPNFYSGVTSIVLTSLSLLWVLPCAATPATDALEAGRKLQRRGKFNESFPFFEQAIALDPKLAAAYLERGEFYRMAGSLDESDKDFNKAIELDSRLSKAYFYRGLNNETRHQYDQAVQQFTRAIQLGTADPSVYSYRGDVYRRIGKYGKAVADYNTLLISAPGTVDIFFGGIGLDDKDKSARQQIIADCTLSIKANRDAAAAYFNRGLTHHECSEPDQAIADYSEAIKRDPSMLVAYYCRSLIAKPEQGILDNNKLIDLDKKNKAEYLSQRAHCYKRLHAMSKAMEDFNRAIELQPQNAERYWRRGLLYEELGDLDKALSDYNETINLERSSYTYLVSRGDLYRKQGAYQSAIDDYTMASNQDMAYAGSEAEIFRKRALAYAALKQFDKAIEDSDKAVEVYPSEAENYWSRGKLYWEHGDSQKAFDDYNTALSFHPNYEMGRWILRAVIVLGIGTLVFWICRGVWRSKAFIQTIAIGMLFLAPGASGGDYFTLLRFVVCPACAFTAYLFWKVQKVGWTWTLGMIAVLFNPLLPVHLEKETWQLIDVIVGIIITVSIGALGKARGRAQSTVVEAVETTDEPPDQ